MIGIIQKAFEDHYWDSFEKDKNLIMAHINAVLTMLQPADESPTSTPEGLNGEAQRNRG